MSDPSTPGSSVPQPPSADPAYPTATPLDYQYTEPVKKPTSVMVLGILGIVFGSLSVICLPFQFIAAFGGNAMRMGAAASSTYTPTPVMHGWTIISTLIALPMAFALLAGGIGSVTLRQWARKLMVAYAAFSIVFILLSIVMSILIVIPETIRAMNAAAAASPTPPPAWVGTLVAVWTFIVLLICLIYPTFVLIYYRKPHVIDAFNRSAALGM